MTFFLREHDRRFFYTRAASSAVAEDPRPGHLALYNKNDGTTWHVPARQCPDRFGWLLEADTVPDYFRAVVAPSEPSPVA